MAEDRGPATGGTMDFFGFSWLFVLSEEVLDGLLVLLIQRMKVSVALALPLRVMTPEFNVLPEIVWKKRRDGFGFMDGITTIQD